MNETIPAADMLTLEQGPKEQCIIDFVDDAGIENKSFGCRREGTDTTCSAIASNEEGIISMQGVCQALNGYSNAMHYQA